MLLGLGKSWGCGQWVWLVVGRKLKRTSASYSALVSIGGVVSGCGWWGGG